MFRKSTSIQEIVVTEPSGSREQIDSVIIAVQDIFDEKGLVDIVLVLLPDVPERHSSGVDLFHDLPMHLRIDKESYCM